MTLTEVSYYSRKMLPFAILGILVILIVFYLFRIIFFLGGSNSAKVKLTTKLFPGEKIEAPKIESVSNTDSFTFTLDTIEGTPVTATESAKIFVLPPSNTSFGFREKILLIADTLGFDTNVTRYVINEKDATFKDSKQELVVDIANFNFHYQYDMKQDPDLFKNIQTPTETEIIDEATKFLRQIDKYPEEFAQSIPKITYLTYNPDTTQLDISETYKPTSNMVEVDFFRPDIQAVPANISTVTSKFPNSHNYVAMVFNDQQAKVVKAQVSFFPTSEETSGIYPLKSGDIAWDQLKNGKGYIINALPTQKNIAIKKMFLAYYDPDVYQPYMQPVYVFVGDNNFIGYVPAVLDSLLVQ